MYKLLLTMYNFFFNLFICLTCALCQSDFSEQLLIEN